MKVLVTGGAGYVGHAVVAALAADGATPIVLDDLSSGDRARIAGHTFFHGDAADDSLLLGIASAHEISAIVHCAGQKSASESLTAPLATYQANLTATITLARFAMRIGCPTFVFSSSAAVYGDRVADQLRESDLARPASPYARSKAFAEHVLADAAAMGELRVVIFRYFNIAGTGQPLGAHWVGQSDVMSRLAESARDGSPFALYGLDWPTIDGTAVRDYVALEDVAFAHTLALRERVRHQLEPEVFNLGRGIGVSVAQLIDRFRHVYGRRIKIRPLPRRPGDVPGSPADISRARTLLAWHPEGSLEQMIESYLNRRE